MGEPKTKPATTADAINFLRAVADPQRQKDCFTLIDWMKEATGAEPILWGTSIVGFGKYGYKYASGHSGEWPVIGFSPRKNDLTIYIMPGLERFPDLMAKLGKYKTGKSCLYLKKLSDVDSATLKELMRQTVAVMSSQRVDS